jgi:hypothetical protein
MAFVSVKIMRAEGKAKSSAVSGEESAGRVYSNEESVGDIFENKGISSRVWRGESGLKTTGLELSLPDLLLL